MYLLTRRSVFILFSCAVMIAVFGVPNSLLTQAYAQNDKADAGAAAPAAGEPAAGDPAAPGGDAAPVAQQSALAWLIHTSGWIGGVLLLMSIYFVGLVIQCFMELRTQVVNPPELMQEWESLLASRDYQGIYASAKADSSQLGQLVAAGLASLSGGLADARESVDRMGETVTVEMEKRISMLAVIGSLGPLIGLLGTLKGMISSFSVIARSETQLKPSEVAGGISEALLITFEGVALSVPAIFLFALFKNRVASLSLQAIMTADEFIRKVQSTAQGKPAVASGQKPKA